MMTIRNDGTDGDEYYTKESIRFVREVMGSIDLDPASCAAANATVQAKGYFSKADNGLQHAWRGNVFLNPPYSRGLVAQFTEKLLAEYALGHVHQAIALMNSSPSTAWFQSLLRFPVCFRRGREKFWCTDGKQDKSPRYDNAYFYLGPNVDRFAEVFAAVGTVLVPYHLATTQACAVCGGPFVPKRADALYCSPACNQRAKRRRAKVAIP